MTLEQPAPKIYNLSPEQPFADTLAAGLLDRYAARPDTLSDLLLLLPNRRACRSLGDAFLRRSEGRALLLPRLVPLGDPDEEELILTAPLGLSGEAETGLPQAMPPLRRQFRLAGLVRRWRRSFAAGGPFKDGGDAQDLLLAEELARLIDHVETEGLDFSGLERLAPEELADHWQTTLRFLEIVTGAWPAVEREEGAIGPAARRRRLMEWQAEAWARRPPRFPILAAGSTGSIPATTRLLSVVARLPEGEIVLPGLDQDCAEDAWEAIAEDPSHPQFGLAQLLAGLGVRRKDVKPWSQAASNPELRERGRLVNLSLTPAPLTERWVDAGSRADLASLGAAFAGVRRVDCPGPREEAQVIALALREVLEMPGRTGALVTPDRNLARRVAAELRRWGVEIDDSAGKPLEIAPVGAFLRLVARLVAEGPQPLDLLAVLKHPLCAGAQDPGRFRALVRSLERLVLRGPLPAANLPRLQELIAESRAEAERKGWRAEARELERLHPWFAELCGLLESVARRRPSEEAFERLLRDHLGLAESLAQSGDREGADRLWAGADGEEAAGFLKELLEAAGSLDVVRVRDYAELFDALLARRVVRPRYGLHPRLFIWGPMEARLQRADRVILGGLNEATWPAEPDPGPWMSRPMRKAFGLPPPERAIGLAAHDYAQAMSAGEVFLTRSERIEGAPTVPSRWLLRLDTLLKALGAPTDLLTRESGRWIAWAEALDQPAQEVPSARPGPKPPKARRPRKASVTELERWQRDPYAFYAGAVLRLRKLDDLDAEPGAAERGTLIHEWLEKFTRDFPERLPEDLEAELDKRKGDLLDKLGRRPALAAYWEPRLERILAWVAEQERRRRPRALRVHAERRGQLELPEADGFLLHGKADRIEELSDGRLAVLDYKTGAPPAKKDVLEGKSPQLLLEAVIAEAGGFKDFSAKRVAELVYWRLSGGAIEGAETAIVLEDGLVEETRARLAGFLRVYADPATPFLARPRPAFDLRYNDFAHLARIKEWAADEGEG